MAQTLSYPAPSRYLFRMKTSYVRCFVAALALAGGFLLSCSSASNDAGGCTQGQSVQCTGVSGCIGTQLCSSDGATYGECSCGFNVSSVGGNATTGTSASGANSRSGGGTGGNSSAGGQPYTPTGGAGASGSLGCVPRSMSGQAYPPYIPARHLRGSCTEQTILDYYNICYLLGECSAFMKGGPYETCGACLAPSELTASSFGPLLRVGVGALEALETNVAGCEEILGEVACSANMQVEFLCQYGACANSCPVTDSASFDGLLQCMTAAITSQCASQHTAAQCLKNASNAAPCSGSSFQEQFTAVAKVFCIN